MRTANYVFAVLMAVLNGYYALQGEVLNAVVATAIVTLLWVHWKLGAWERR